MGKEAHKPITIFKKIFDLTSNQQIQIKTMRKWYFIQKIQK